MDDLQTSITPILKQAGVTRAALFGSVARGEAKPDSDVDLLIEFDKSQKKSLFDLVRLEDNLEQVLHKEVDLVTFNALRPELKGHILADQKVIYGARF